MHKKLESELIHLAHQILKMNDATKIGELRDKARIIYENLSVLSFIDDYFVDTPAVTDSKENFLESLNNLTTNKVANVPIKSTPVIEKKVEAPKKIEKPIEKKTEPLVSKEEKISAQEGTEKLVKQTVSTIKSEAKDIATKIHEKSKENPKPLLADEMKGSIPADVAANMFKRAERIVEVETPKPTTLKKKIKTANEFAETVKKEALSNHPIATKPIKQETVSPSTGSKSLNDKVFNQRLQVGLNDRIAFVKHLFNYSQEDFNRVLSQLNTLGSEKECKDLIFNQVKPDYDWDSKEEYVNRLVSLVERKFN